MKIGKEEIRSLILKEARKQKSKKGSGSRDLLRKLIIREAKKMGLTDAPKEAWPTPTSKVSDVANKAEFEKMKVDKEAAKLVSHTCANHVLMESSKDLNRLKLSEDSSVGKCVWHTLDESGNISHYDVQFGEKVVKNIPASKLIVISEKNHMHETREKRSNRKS